MRRGVKLAIGIPVAIVGTMFALSGLVVLAFVGFDGTFTTPPTSVSTDTHAIVLSASFVDEDLASRDLGSSSVTIAVDGEGDDVFVGVGSAADVARYLDDVPYAEATRLSYPGSDLELRRVDGSERPTPPTDEAFWSASRKGDGELTWDLDDGDWSVVVMNADGTAGVTATGTVTARIPALATAIAVMFLLGLPLVGVGVAMIVSALRRGDEPRRATGRSPAPPPPGSVPPRPDLPGGRPGA